MSKEMIISVNGREKKIAVIENGQVTEFYIERDEENTGVVGNIYKGRVQRVLPGMQSAFVDIGLDRDAFLYVSDFFDEEEEIERIVNAKSKEKKSTDEAEREATDNIYKKRLKRDKKIDVAQEKAEVGDGKITIDEQEADEIEPLESNDDEIKKPKRGRPPKQEKEKKQKPSRRGRKPKNEDTETPNSRKSKTKKTEEVETLIFERENVLDASGIEFEESGFERVVDEEGETGAMLKDALVQDAISNQVKAIEFDMESTETAEVGSVMEGLKLDAGGFERIADDDEDEPQKPKRRTRKTASSRKKAAPKKPTRKKSTTRKSKNDKAEADSEVAEGTETKKKASAKAGTKTTRRKTTSRKKKSESSSAKLDDAEASVKESIDSSEMAVRRGSRGGRRRNSPKASQEKAPITDSDTHMDKGYKTIEHEEPITAENEIADAELQSKKPKRRGRRNQRSQPKISDLLREGQEVVVQIAKEPIAKKGARITSHIALPGRYLVYMPTIEHLGVSRKISSTKERTRLRKVLQEVVTNRNLASGGFIVRTAGIGKSAQKIGDDAEYLENTWKEIKKTAEKSKSPALVHQDLDIILRLLRDQLSDDFTAIRVDSEEEYLRIVEFVNRIQPKLVKRVKFHTLDQPILDTYGVTDEIDKALKHRVWLRSGGYLVINQTEALIAIDVNTGKFVGKGNARLEDTITKTNLEAVDEIARQIRLRDLGGIIVLDLIDMEDRRNRNRVQKALQDALSRDKSPTKVLSFNDFGLIIMTRKRVKQSLERTLCAPCSYCEGAGWVKSPQTICYEILDESRRLSKELSDVRQTTLRVHPIVAETLRDGEKEVLNEIEEYLGVVDLTGDTSIHQEQFDFAFI